MGVRWELSTHLNRSIDTSAVAKALLDLAKVSIARRATRQVCVRWITDRSLPRRQLRQDLGGRTTNTIGIRIGGGEDLVQKIIARVVIVTIGLRCASHEVVSVPLRRVQANGRCSLATPHGCDPLWACTSRRQRMPDPLLGARERRVNGPDGAPLPRGDLLRGEACGLPQTHHPVPR